MNQTGDLPPGDTQTIDGDGDLGGTDAAGQTASAVIGPDGGTLTSSDGVVTLTVPPGAVEADTTFSIALDGDALADVRRGAAYDLGPAEVDFTAPIAVTFANGTLDVASTRAI